MPQLAALQASLWIGYFSPSLIILVPLLFFVLFGLIDSDPWWSLLVQVLLGLFSSIVIGRIVLGRERVWVFMPDSGVEASDAIDFTLTLVSAAAFGFLYQLERPLDDSIPVREVGAIAALVLVFAVLALCDLAKQFWFRFRFNELRSTRVLVELSAIVLAIDLLAWGEKGASRIGIGVVLGVRYLILFVHLFAFPRRN